MESPDGGEDLLYLVRETKGLLNPDDLRPDERRKIACGRRHFSLLRRLERKLSGRDPRERAAEWRCLNAVHGITRIGHISRDFAPEKKDHIAPRKSGHVLPPRSSRTTLPELRRRNRLYGQVRLGDSL
jgi:Endonuclease domain